MRVKVSEDASENAKRELKDYKDKAARILQVRMLLNDIFLFFVNLLNVLYLVSKLTVTISGTRPILKRTTIKKPYVKEKAF